MIRRHLVPLRAAVMLVDGITTFVLFLLVSVLRFGAVEWQTIWLEQTGITLVQMAVLYSIIWVGTGWLFGLYRLRARWTARGDLQDVVRVTAIVAVIVLSALFVLKLPSVSRLFLVLLFASQVVVTFAARVGMRHSFGLLKARGFGARYMLVVGAGSAAQEFADLVERHRELGMRVIGHLTAPSDEEPVVSRPVLGSVERIEQLFNEQVIDEVAICLPPADWNLIEPLTLLCREVGKAARIPLDAIGLTWPNGRVEEFEGSPLLSHIQMPDRALGLAGKRLLDIVLSAVALVVLSPVIVGAALLIRVTEGSPVLFRQVRVGQHGRLFTILKFRTMVADAEDRYEEVVALSDTQGPAFKMTNDPRITALGRLLRRSSIDELPQLWNVLRGEMSLVGPRPAPPREVAGYGLWHRRRLSVRPGITGLWQVEARRDEDFDWRATLDLRYIDQWSVFLDLRIMLKTIPALLNGR